MANNGHKFWRPPQSIVIPLATDTCEQHYFPHAISFVPGQLARDSGCCFCPFQTGRVSRLFCLPLNPPYCTQPGDPAEYTHVSSSMSVLPCPSSSLIFSSFLSHLHRVLLKMALSTTLNYGGINTFTTTLISQWPVQQSFQEWWDLTRFLVLLGMCNSPWSAMNDEEDSLWLEDHTCSSFTESSPSMI